MSARQLLSGIRSLWLTGVLEMGMNYGATMTDLAFGTLRTILNYFGQLTVSVIICLRAICSSQQPLKRVGGGKALW